MSFCFCYGTVSSPKARACDDCVTANDIIVGCGQGLMPCGGTTTIDLNKHNGNGSDAVYAIEPAGYSAAEFSSVSVTSTGQLSIVTGPAYTAHGLHTIKYVVTKGRFKDWGEISFCLDSPCQSGCGTCNACSGECYGNGTGPETVVSNCGDIGETYDAAAGLNLGACDGTTTWSVVADTGIAPVIDSNGLITYDVLNDVVPGQKYRVKWTASCSLYGMSTGGWFDVAIQDLCIGVSCGSDQVCVPCDGSCIDIESDMIVSGSGIGTGSGTGMSLT